MYILFVFFFPLSHSICAIFSLTHSIWVIFSFTHSHLFSLSLSLSLSRYYVIQVLQRGGSYALWTRWGRVGESGQNDMKYGDLNTAITGFKKKFQDKTSNKWDDRDNFQKRAGKYDMVDMADAEEVGDTSACCVACLLCVFVCVG